MNSFKSQSRPEIYLGKIEYKEKISLFEKLSADEKVVIKMLPTLLIHKEKNVISLNIICLFYLIKENKEISKPFDLTVFFKVKDITSIFQFTEKEISLSQPESIFKIIDISIGTLRGILYEQIKNKYDQEFIFPPIHIKEFMKELKLQIIS